MLTWVLTRITTHILACQCQMSNSSSSNVQTLHLKTQNFNEITSLKMLKLWICISWSISEHFLSFGISVITFHVWIYVLHCFFGNLWVPSCQRASRANPVFICQMATIKIFRQLGRATGEGAENILGEKNWHTVKREQNFIQFSSKR